MHITGAVLVWECASVGVWRVLVWEYGDCAMWESRECAGVVVWSASVGVLVWECGKCASVRVWGVC